MNPENNRVVPFHAPPDLDEEDLPEGWVGDKKIDAAYIIDQAQKKSKVSAQIQSSCVFIISDHPYHIIQLIIFCQAIRDQITSSEHIVNVSDWSLDEVLGSSYTRTQ